MADEAAGESLSTSLHRAGRIHTLGCAQERGRRQGERADHTRLRRDAPPYSCALVKLTET